MGIIIIMIKKFSLRKNKIGRVLIMKKKSFKSSLESYLFLSPFLAIFLLFLAYPIIYSLYLSFHEIVDYAQGFSNMDFVGLKHYKTLMGDLEFWWSLIITFFIRL